MSTAPRITRVGIRAYELPLVRPIRSRGVALAVRSGFLLHVEDDAGHAGLGEAAPLPGLHAESVEETCRQLLDFAVVLEGERIPDDCAALDGAFSRWLGKWRLFPSVRCAVEGAVLSLLAGARGTTLPRLLAEYPAPTVRINALLAGDAATVVKGAVRRVAEGYRCLKIKVGRGNAQAEARLVAEVRSAVGHRIALRLDANRAWNLDTAVGFAWRVEPLGIAYLEEPLWDPAGRAPFADRCGVPVALDESLLGLDPAGPGPLPGITAFILKPEVLGGFEAAMAWVRAARECGLTAVVSAAFPSAVGLALDAAFAAALGEGTAHGLGTFDFLAADLARRPLDAPGGRIDVTALPLSPADFRLEQTRVLR